MKKSEELLIEIARCENFINCENTDCKKIVEFQSHLPEKQLPEPWDGDMENCKILFISSNPSLNEIDFYPSLSWKNEDIIDFFQNRFSLSKNYVRNYLYPKHNIKTANDNDVYANTWVRYWAFVRSISRRLLETQDIKPGVDYALMEIVRCKSRDEYGVNEALDVCADKYLRRTLELSNARVIIAIGDKSRDILTDKLKINFKADSHVKMVINGIERFIFALPHTNARKRRTLDAIINQNSIQEIIEILK